MALRSLAIPEAPVFSCTGLTGAVSATRYVGGTTSGAPTSGTFTAGDFVVARDGKIWICTVAGTPGTWVDPAAGSSSGSSSQAFSFFAA